MTGNLSIRNSVSDNDNGFDLIICCGKGIGPKGEIDWVLEARIKVSIELLQSSPNGKLLLSGGIGVTADDTGKNMTEADAMELYIQSTMPSLISRVFKEASSEGSLDQLCRIKSEIILPSNYLKIALVTDEFHIDRMSVLFDAVLGEGFDAKYYGSRINLYGKYRQLIEEFERQNFEGSQQIVSLIPRGREDLFAQYDSSYRELRKRRLGEGKSKLEFINPVEVVEYMKSKGLI